MNLRSFLAVLYVSTACYAQETKPSEPPTVKLGNVTLRPGGFLDLIGMSRSAETADSISTHFGNIPLDETPGESLASLRHSRVQLRGDLPWKGLTLSGYLEGDFLNIAPSQSDWRWRHYWGRVKFGKWEVLGGRAWSLLRPNREGVATDNEHVNTDVIDPAYHVGLLGSRRRQLQLARALGDYKAAFAWETQGNFLLKLAAEKSFGHLEFTAFTGHRGRRGLTVSSVVNLSQTLRFVTQEYWSKRAAFEALGVVPTGPNGVAAIEGFEWQAARRLELYSYAGLVYASRSGGNRLVRQATVGADYRIGVPSIRGSVLMSLQYSNLERGVWTGASGSMQFVMYRVRYTFN